MGPFAMTGLPDGMIAVVSGAAVAAHSVGSAVAAVAAQEHSASAFGIVADKMDIGALHLQWHLWSAHLRGSDKLARLQEAGPSIASERVPEKWWLSLAILLHFLDLILNNNNFLTMCWKLA
jgi:hypothetical protein